MSLQTGTRLGRYEIVSPLGSGGMGEVYRARDLTLRRDVAIKVLRDEFATDAERLKRFEREATATAALNHPNILAMHDVGTHDGVTYVVSELLEGRTLSDLLAAGPLAQRKATRIAAQIADGLGAAHAKGIVHRDIKPANVFVVSDDRIKILDFGLARMVEGSPLGDGPGATTTNALTTSGTVLGSAGYMAPEQVRGQAADHRADIFSLGVVLYEMLTGQRAFRRDTVTGTLAAIVESDPPSWNGDGSPASQRVMRLVRRCLEKSPNDRFQSARDLSLLLADESDSTALASQPQATQGRRPWLAWLAAGLIGAAIGVPAWSKFGAKPSSPVDAARVAFEIPPPEGSTWAGGGHLAIANDGTRIAFVASRGGQVSIFVRQWSDLSVRELPGTIGARLPFFSPEGRRIGFFADGLLKVIEIDTGALLTLCEAPTARGGTWTESGDIVFAAGAFGPLSRIAAKGGPVTPLTTLGAGEASHRFPAALPGSAGVVFNIFETNGQSRVGAVDPQTGRHTVVVERGDSPQFGRGRLFYVNDHSEWMALPFDAATRTVSGPAEPQAATVAQGANIGDQSFRVSQNGSVVYLPYEATVRSLAIVGRDGRLEPVPGPDRSFDSIRLSPDGSRVAATISSPTGGWGDVWIGDLKGNFVPFTRDGVSRHPVWSPSGDRIGFTSRRDGVPAVFVQPMFGGTAARLTDGQNESTPVSWLPDGKTLQINITNPLTGTTTVATIKEGNTTPSIVPVAVKGTAYAKPSPDGRWMAFTHADSGQWEVYVTTIPVSERVWLVSGAKTGREPVWSPQSNQLYFRRADGRLVAVPITANGPSASGPVDINLGGATFVLDQTTPGLPRYDVFPDGRILIERGESNRQRVRPIVVIAR